ncbi:MAG: DNA-directed RNA polymerase subunit omega [Candidatus Dasytiphilus stammeri]
MARITVQNAFEKIDNRFDLVLIAAKRARQIQIYNHDPLVEYKDDKLPVIALREIEAGLITKSIFDIMDDEDTYVIKPLSTHQSRKK